MYDWIDDGQNITENEIQILQAIVLLPILIQTQALIKIYHMLHHHNNFSFKPLTK